MLAMRLQRTGRKGNAHFRLVVQDSRFVPTSGKFVAHLGSYNPHAKQFEYDKEKAVFYLENGAQPSESVARLLKADGVTLPSWVKLSTEKKRAVKSPEKLRKNQPKEEAPAEEPAAEAATEEVVAETEAETQA